VLVGILIAPHGLRGEMRVYPQTDAPERIETLQRVGVQMGDGPVRPTRITAVRATGRRIVMKLDGVNTIDAAEALRGAKILTSSDWIQPLEEWEFYHAQLIGLEVVTTTGEALGRITQIFETGANDVYETPLALIPATRDMIRAIDLAAGRMIVDARPGLKKSDKGD